MIFPTYIPIWRFRINDSYYSDFLHTKSTHHFWKRSITCVFFYRHDFPTYSVTRYSNPSTLGQRFIQFLTQLIDNRRLSGDFPPIFFYRLDFSDLFRCSIFKSINFLGQQTFSACTGSGSINSRVAARCPKCGYCRRRKTRHCVFPSRIRVLWPIWAIIMLMTSPDCLRFGRRSLFIGVAWEVRFRFR